MPTAVTYRFAYLQPVKLPPSAGTRAAKLIRSAEWRIIYNVLPIPYSIEHIAILAGTAPVVQLFKPQSSRSSTRTRQEGRSSELPPQSLTCDRRHRPAVHVSDSPTVSLSTTPNRHPQTEYRRIEQPQTMTTVHAHILTLLHFPTISIRSLDVEVCPSSKRAA